MAVDFDEVAEYYDTIYGAEEEYRAEAERIKKVAREYGAGNKLLDIACGTGLAAKYLSDSFIVTGVDLSEGMLAAARKNAPRAAFLHGDMLSLTAGQDFDIAVNLYGTAGFARNTQELCAMCQSACESLKPGGLFLLTPWETKETFREEIITGSGQNGKISFCRMEAVRRKDEHHAEIEMVHLIGITRSIKTIRCTQEISLFSEEEYRSALCRAGFSILKRFSEAEFRMGAFLCRKISYC